MQGAPPPRGWFALLATVVIVAANGAVSVYLEPLAHQAGLSANVARLALFVSLGRASGGRHAGHPDRRQGALHHGVRRLRR